MICEPTGLLMKKLFPDARRARDYYGSYEAGTTLNIHCTLMNILLFN